MSKMKELYEKVAADSALQSRIYEILANAEKAGEAETGRRFVAFAKEEGYDITLEEMIIFFKELSEEQNRELNSAELDQVAGGKADTPIIVMSVLSLGLVCGMISLVLYSMQTDPSCKEALTEHDSRP